MKQRKTGILIFAALLVIMCSSCMSTRVYEKNITQVFQDEKIIGEDETLLRDGKVIHKSGKTFVMAKSDGFDVEAFIEKSTKETYETTDIQLKKNGLLIAQRQIKSKDGAIANLSQGKSANSKYDEAIDYGDFIYVEGPDNDIFVAKTEVTQEDYMKVMEKNPSNNQGDRLPVENISFFDALEYCNRLSNREHLTPVYSVNGNTWKFNVRANGYRLLSKTEFLYASGGGKYESGFKYSGSNTVGTVSWYEGNSKGKTHEVAKKMPNELGLYDMGGNVAEWCWDENDFVVCGGSYTTSQKDMGSQYVLTLEKDGQYIDAGFRIARNASPEEKRLFSEKKKLMDNIDIYFQNAFRVVHGNKAVLSSEEDSGTLRQIEKTEQVTVHSSPNGKYIAYSIAGKPFVIIGTAAWNLLKCTGYAFINFAGGYSTARGDNGFLWKMPDTKKAREKAKEARANNGIAHYPEYHLPFTDNKIEVTARTSEVTNAFSRIREKEVKVISEEHFTYDNSISVNRSVVADANSTASVAGLIGTVITVPVSAITWVGGAVFGIYSSIYSK